MNVETSTHLGRYFYLKRSLGLLRNPRRMASPKVAQLRSAFIKKQSLRSFAGHIQTTFVKVPLAYCRRPQSSNIMIALS